jgi:hypothetical protein
VNEEQLTDARGEVQALVGRRICNAQMGFGTILLLDFQDVGNSPVDAYVRSESAWLLAQKGLGLVGSLDDRDSQARVISTLVGTAVVGLDLRRHLQLNILLSNEYELVLLPSYAVSAEYENWVLRLPTAVVYTAGPGPKLFRTLANEP